jgi:hypothetical protein
MNSFFFYFRIMKQDERQGKKCPDMTEKLGCPSTNEQGEVYYRIKKDETPQINVTLEL